MWSREAQEKYQLQLFKDIAEMEKDFKPDGFGTRYFASLSNKKISPKYVGKYMEQLSRISEGLDRIVQDVSQRERHDKKFFIHPEISKYLVGGPFPGINYVNPKRLDPTEEHPNAAFFKKNGKVYKVTTDVASITAETVNDPEAVAISIDEPLSDHDLSGKMAFLATGDNAYDEVSYSPLIKCTKPLASILTGESEGDGEELQDNMYFFMIKDDPNKTEEGSPRADRIRGTPAFVYHEGQYRPVGVALAKSFEPGVANDPYDKKYPGLGRAMVFITLRKTLDEAIDKADQAPRKVKTIKWPLLPLQ
jgi:hypothetical protein